MTDDTPRKKISLTKPVSTLSSEREPLRGRHAAKRVKPTPLTKAKAADSQSTSSAVAPASTPNSEQRRKRPRPDAPPPEKHGPRRDKTPALQSHSSMPEAAKPGEKTRTLLDFFAPCPRGLETELAKELAELEAEAIETGHGGCAFRASMPQAWKICLWSRLAIRVLWRVDQGQYRKEDDLYNAALALPWPLWFNHGKTIAVTTIARISDLKSLNFVTLRIKDAICDKFRSETGERPSVQTRNPDVPLLLYLDHDAYTLYIDLAGTPLNRRGFRVHASNAPINENLAAGMLRLSGWHPGMPLLDPMMGGGTILLEAAMMALNQAPGLKRHFAFENLTGFRDDLWARIVGQAEKARKTPGPMQLFGCDIDPRMVHAAQANFRAASVGWCIEVMEGDARSVAAPTDTGMIVTNPPYGVRLETEDMTALYKDIGDNLKRDFTDWTAWFISADPEFPKAIGLKATRRTPLYNGPLECRFYRYDLVAGQNRRKPDARD